MCVLRWNDHATDMARTAGGDDRGCGGSFAVQLEARAPPLHATRVCERFDVAAVAWHAADCGGGALVGTRRPAGD